MKKTKYIELVLITAALASCNKPNKDWEGSSNGRKYLRSDTTAPYTRTHVSTHGISPLLWYYAFRPYGYYRNGFYKKAGYYSDGLNEAGNFGSNTYKSVIARGGFGNGSYSVSS